MAENDQVKEETKDAAEGGEEQAAAEQPEAGPEGTEQPPADE